jgi:single-stranded DNA-binding protein
MAINRVLLLGTVADPGPKLAYSERGSPECRLVLKLTEPSKARQEFSVFIPVYVYGSGAESVAEPVDAGDLVSVDGRLGWKGALQKNGCKIGLVVSCFGVELITKAPALAETAGEANRVRTLFTSVRNEADRVGPT